MPSLEERIKRRACELGFELTGIAPATPADGLDRLRAWLDRGYAGEMTYMHRQASAGGHPAAVLPEVRSVVMVGLNYAEKETDRKGDKEVRGKIARYARGADYHDVLRKKLNQLLVEIREQVPGCKGR